VKIIGKTKDGFILEAHTDELSQLVGWSSTWMQSRNTKLGYGNELFRIGEEIAVHAMYDSLTAMAGLEKKMADARAILNTVAGGLTMVDPIIRKVTEAIGPIGKE
jgi:hypothetical protein